MMHTRFRLTIPEGHPGRERVELGAELNRCIVRDLDGKLVLLVPRPSGVPLVIRSGMALTTEEADELVAYLTTAFGGRHTTAL